MSNPESPTTACTSREPCCHPDMCKQHGICLGSDEGVAYQEATMKAFFNWLLPQYEGWTP